MDEHQKQFSIWYLAIRVCDYGIAGLFQLQRIRRVIFFLIASMIMSTGFTAAEEDKWIALFDGKTLNGWEKVGSEESKWVVPILANANSIAPSWGTELGLLFIDGSHTETSAMNDYDNWCSKLHPQGGLVIHDIYEKPEDGGQAPYLIYQKALAEGFQLHERVDTIVCLTKT